MPPDTPADRPGSRALFVDRDGTLMPDLHYLAEPDRVEVYRGVARALGLAREHGYRIVCVTNQSGVERGLYTRGTVEEIHRRLNERLTPFGGQIDAFYYCPHAPESGCGCRKPGTLLFETARTDARIEFSTSAIIGDRWLDVEAGRRLGLLTALVPPVGRRAEVDAEMRQHGLAADILADSFPLALARVLARG